LRTILIVAVLSLGLIACTGDPYRLPTPPEYDRTKYRELGYVEAHAVGRLLSYIPIGATDSIERAMKLALAKSGGDALTEVTVTQRWSIILFTSQRVSVRALALKKIQPGEPETDYERGRREMREQIERGSKR
jgi:hypothetical protein